MQASIFIAVFLGVCRVAYCDNNTEVNQGLGAFTPSSGVSWRHATSKEIDKQFGEIYTGNVTNQEIYTFWFIGSRNGNFNDATVNVYTRVDHSQPTNPVRFEVHWEEFPDHPSRSWLLPIMDSNGSVYRDSNKTLCSNINEIRADLTSVTVKITVSTLSGEDDPLNFSLSVFFGESNLVSLNDTRDFDLTLFSPVYYKLKTHSSMSRSRYALLEITSTNDICITVALQSLECPLLDKERDVKLGRHLTMSTTASMTIEMDDLNEGRFLVFVMHQNDSKCNSNQCAGCWNNEILPLGQDNRSVGNQRQKYLNFSLTAKISDRQYIISTSASIGLYFTIFLGILCFVIYCTFKSVQLRRANSEIILAGSSGSINATIEQGAVVVNCGENDRLLLSANSNQNEEPQREDDYLFGCIRRKFGARCCTDVNRVTHAAKKRSAQRYFGILLVNAIFYILPAIQLIWIYQRVYKLTGNEDMCYYNFRCLHPLFGLIAFNHLFSNVGYVVLGLLFCIIVKFDTKDRHSSGIYMAMGISLVIQGVMSALYHTCPNHISFQFDTCFMYITSMLCWVIVFQAQHPDTNTSAILTHAIVAIAVTLGVAAVVTKVWYFWICITTVHLFVCFIFSFHLDSIRGKYSWNFMWPWKINSRKNLVSSFLRPVKRWNVQKVFLVLYNILNWVAAGVGLWTNQKSQDFASFLLILFIFNLSIFSVSFVWVRYKERKVSLQTWAYIVASISTWIGAFYFYLKVTSSWSVSPAESRTLNKDCILFEFFDHHDIWHFLSAFGMFLNFMFFFTLDDVTLPPCPQPNDNAPSSTAENNGVPHQGNERKQETSEGDGE